MPISEHINASLYKCKVCTVQTKFKRSLTKHIKNVHKKGRKSYCFPQLSSNNDHVEHDVLVKTEAKLDTVHNLGEKGEYFEYDVSKTEIKSE